MQLRNHKKPQVCHTNVESVIAECYRLPGDRLFPSNI